MWYVIQTITGKEKELVEVIDKILVRRGYDRCFVLQQECVWRLKGQYCIHIEPLFPSYVFVETDIPEEFFYALKQVPKLTKLLGREGIFDTVKKEEEELLCQLIGSDETYIVRRSLVKVDSDGMIVSAEGALEAFYDRIVQQRLRKRSVIVEIPFLGEIKRIRMGIRLEDDPT